MTDQYETKLTPEEEKAFQPWKQQYAPKDSGQDYDLRGAFKAGLTPDPNNGHWSDQFKKPNHETFSVESQYAVGANAAKAGHWEGEQFVPASKNKKEVNVGNAVTNEDNVSNDPQREAVGNGQALPPAPPVMPPPLVMPAETITGSSYTGSDIVRNNPYVPPATSPLSGSDYVKYQINGNETRKDTITAEAANLSHGQDEVARINREAAAEQRRMLFGNPEELLKAQQTLASASALPDTHPEKQAQVQKAQLSIQANAGARPLLQQAMVDAETRDTALRAEIQKARSEKIDPDHWWNQKSTGAKILAGIGMVLGGAGGGVARTGRNPAMDVMNSAIQNDMDSQRHHIDNHWKSIATEHGLNQDAFGRELHRQTWENNYRTSALEHIKLNLNEAAASTQSESVKNNAVNMIQTLTDEQMKLRNQQWILGVQAQQAELNRRRAMSKEADKDVQELMKEKGVDYHDAVDAVYSRPHYRELTGTGMAPPEQGQKALQRLEAGKREEQLKQNGMSSEEARAVVVKEFPDAFKTLGVIVPDTTHKNTEKDERERTVTIGGQNYMGRSPKEAEESKVAIESAQEVINVNQKIAALTAKARNSTFGLGPSDRATLDALLAQGALHYPRMQTGSTRINETEIKMGKDTYSGSGDLFRGDALNRQQAMIGTITAQAESRIKDARSGLTPIGGAVNAPAPETKSSPPKGPAKGLEK